MSHHTKEQPTCSTSPAPSKPRGISDDDRLQWLISGRLYALRLLTKGASPSELLSSLSLAIRGLSVLDLDGVVDAFDAPAVASRRSERKAALIEGAMSVAFEAGAMRIGAADDAAEVRAVA